MKSTTATIRALRGTQPLRLPDDPLRNFLSEVILRDHARLLKLRLRQLHVGELLRNGDLVERGGVLKAIPVLWWRRARAGDGDHFYRAEP